MKADREIKDTKLLGKLSKKSYWYSIETKLSMRYRRCEIEDSQDESSVEKIQRATAEWNESCQILLQATSVWRQTSHGQSTLEEACEASGQAAEYSNT